MNLAQGAAGSFAVKTVGVAVVFATQVFLTRMLGTEDFGIYVYVLSWVTTLMLVAIWGWDTAAIRLVAAYAAGRNWGLLRGLLAAGRGAVLVTSVGVAGALAVTVWALPSTLDPNLTTVFWVGCLLLPIAAQLQLGQSTLLGFQRVVKAQLPDAVLRPAALVGSAAVLFLGFGYPATAATTLFLTAATGLAALGIVWYWVRETTPPEVRLAAPETRRGEWARIALPLLLVTGFQVLMRRVDILMLGTMVGPAEAGIYAVASRVAELAAFGLIAANAVLAPMISNLHSRGRREELQKILTFATAAISLVTIVCALGVLFFGELILSIFGKDFTIGYGAMAILVVGQVVNSLAGPVGFLMTMTGHQVNAAYILGASTVLNGCLNFALIPVYGLQGAALATALAMVAWNVAMVWYVRRRLKISPTVLSILGTR
jgi:O-antigen/teichoic acid export membrane protein